MGPGHSDKKVKSTKIKKWKYESKNDKSMNNTVSDGSPGGVRYGAPFGGNEQMEISKQKELIRSALQLN